MRVYTHTLAGRERTIYFPESRRDVHGFADFLARGDKVLGLDTETTGLNIYSRGWACRLVQFGNRDTAWVLRADLFADVIRDALRQPRHFTVHNAAFDLQVIDRAFGVRIEELGPRTFDTRILAHLLDPRQRHEGGAGLSLKELSEVYVDPSAPDTSKDLHAIFRSEYKATKVTGWALIDIDHPTYVVAVGLHPLALRSDEQHLARGARQLGEAVGQDVDAGLALGAGDAQVLGERAARQARSRTEAEEQHDPGEQRAPRVTGHEVAEAVQRGRHADTLVY